MDRKEIARIFYRDGYRLAHQYLEQGINAQQLILGIGHLYTAVDELLESFINRSALEGRPAACKKGCSWCCNQEVFAVTHEFLYLREHLEKQVEVGIRTRILDRARSKAKLTRSLPLEEKLQVRAPCPFLESGSCLVYDARPMACHIYLSSSAEACKRDHDHPGDKRHFPDLYQFPLQAGRMMNEGFVAYLKQSGFEVSEFSLEQGYASMMDVGQTMEAWIDSRSATL